jgi:hypothetical protein
LYRDTIQLRCLKFLRLETDDLRKDSRQDIRWDGEGLLETRLGFRKANDADHKVGLPQRHRCTTEPVVYEVVRVILPRELQLGPVKFVSSFRQPAPQDGFYRLASVTGGLIAPRSYKQRG